LNPPYFRTFTLIWNTGETDGSESEETPLFKKFGQRRQKRMHRYKKGKAKKGRGGKGGKVKSRKQAIAIGLSKARKKGKKVPKKKKS
jgi:hypothetical protein